MRNSSPYDDPTLGLDLPEPERAPQAGPWPRAAALDGSGGSGSSAGDGYGEMCL
ncbi:hypothetical protein [Streptomyces sp. NBC_00989]|uniref:hypothetical protein n=1 Tax=Streptomyces sp. NBC_00989 TaxID=2903705 RepID=UPI0038674ABD|nr:hypothetical protein OG714_02865 [Streptomyces sp. NBC_00989]